MNETPDYAIFISYRRDSGAQYARILKSALENRGYSKRVFLDLDEVPDASDSHIMNAIEVAPIFIFILSPGALDHCVNEDDWVRKEILYALNHERHIIPINFDNLFNGFPKNIPTEIRDGLGQHQFTDIASEQLFDSSMELLINNRIAPLVTPFNLPTNVGAEIAILTDADCYVNRYNKLLTTAHANEVSFIHLQKGNHILEFVSTECPDVKETINEYNVPDNNYNDYIEIKLKDKIENHTQDKFQLICVKNSLGKFGFIDKSNNIVIPYIYNEAWEFSEGLARVKDASGKFGFIDKSNNIVIPCIYNEAWEFSEGLARVKDASGKYGFINKSNNLMIPCIYTEAWEFSNNMALVRDSFQYLLGYIDKNGNEVIPCIYNNANCFSEGLASIEDSSGYWGFINQLGDKVISSSFNFAFEFTEGLARVYDSSGGCGFIDKSGNQVIPCKYNNAWPFSNGLALVEDSSGKNGFINKSGNLVIPCIYNNASPFSEGLARVEDDSGKYGFIDLSGNLAIPCIYEHAWGFSDGLAIIKDSSSKYGLIDKSGKIVIPCIYDDIRH